MLRYIDKHGVPIQRDTWWEHLLDPTYGQVFQDLDVSWEVQASWLGVVSQRERKPGVFLVWAFDLLREKDADGKPITRRKERKCVWTETKEQAVKAAKAMVAELSGEEAA